MEIDKRQLRDFILWLVDDLYKARKQLNAYQVAHTFLAASGLAQELDLLLEQSRKNPSPVLLADHQAAMDTIEQFLSEEKFDEALEFLRNWQPKGPKQ
jgi:hypothetical protein